MKRKLFVFALLTSFLVPLATAQPAHADKGGKNHPGPTPKPKPGPRDDGDGD